MGTRHRSIDGSHDSDPVAVDGSTQSLLDHHAVMASACATTNSPGAVLSLSSPLPLSPAESLLRNSPHPAQLRQQQRFRWTKAKKKRHARYLYRQELVRLGKPLQRPPNFFPKNTGVANSLSKEEREAERQRLDAQVAQALKERIQQQKKEGKIMLRHDFDEVPMSDRVRKLFALHNGNTKEVTMIQKKRSMELFQIREGDTGSSAVQVVALTNRIHQLQAHFSKHKQDKHSRRGMEALINRRRKVLNYLERKDFESYRLVVKALGLRRH